MTLSGSDYILLNALVKHTPPSGQQLALEHLQTVTGLCERTIRNRLKVLQLQGLIAYQKQHGRHLHFKVLQEAHVVLNNVGAIEHAAS